MTSGYPTYTNSARQGEAGVNLVAQVVNDSFRWIFKKNHQEHDFGIDGQLEVVTTNGFVTGQLATVQIKHGTSFFKEKNKWGYVYRGEKKHFNYLSNYPIPVFIVICHPDTKECLWVHFDETQTIGTEKGWKITVPFENDFRTSKIKLLSLLPESKDNLSSLEAYWGINNLLISSDRILFTIIREEIESGDTLRVREFFDRLRSSKELACSCMSKLEFVFSGYDSDPRELFEVLEMRNYIYQLSEILPELLFFINTDKPCYTLPLFAICFGAGFVSGKRANIGNKHRVEFEAEPVAEFLHNKWLGLNEMTDWLNMSIDENKEITYSVIRCLGFEPPND